MQGCMKIPLGIGIPIVPLAKQQGSQQESWSSWEMQTDLAVESLENSKSAPEKAGLFEPNPDILGFNFQKDFMCVSRAMLSECMLLVGSLVSLLLSSLSCPFDKLETLRKTKSPNKQKWELRIPLLLQHWEQLLKKRGNRRCWTCFWVWQLRIILAVTCITCSDDNS